MGFESHKVVKEYIAELDKITATRQELRSRMVDIYELSYKAEDDYERRMHVKSAKDIEQQVNALTNKGNLYMLKIDQLNGVR
jgi:hypothetical protein